MNVCILIECFDFKCVYTHCIDYIIFHILSFQFSSAVNFFIPMSLKKIKKKRDITNPGNVYILTNYVRKENIILTY